MSARSYNLFLTALTLLILLFPSSVESRIYFIHIPKTGGTTLRYLLEQKLKIEEIYPFRNCKQATSKVQHELVFGHFPYGFCKNLDEDFQKAFKITVLRDPVERCLSFLRAKKRSFPEFSDLESVLESKRFTGNQYYLGLLDNSLCKYLAEDPNLEGQALLESAKKNLHQFDHIIFFDHFTEGVLDLFKRLGVTLAKGDVPVLNSTEKEPARDDLIEKIKKRNELDIELYQYAKTLNLENIHSF